MSSSKNFSSQQELSATQPRQKPDCGTWHRGWTLKLDIVFALNGSLDFTLPVVLRSLLDNCSSPSELRINVIVPRGERLHFQALLGSTEWNSFSEIRFCEFVCRGILAEYLWDKYGHETPPRFQGRQMQYARLCIPQLFDDIGPVLYLDTDLVVLKDPLTLLEQVRGFNLAAPEKWSKCSGGLG
jgi:lipopolysaccharide biosynthesis glycosyltransferase